MSKPKIQVDLTREEVESFHRQVLKASTEDQKWNFSVGFSENQLEDIQDEIESKLDTREWKDAEKAHPYVEERIFNKLKIKASKIREFDSTGLQYLPEVIAAFREKLCDLMGIASYKPTQKTIDEAKSGKKE